jgi:membrane protease YdiL (CAAX protease family)
MIPAEKTLNVTVKVISEARLHVLDREHLETLLHLSHEFNSTSELDSLLPRILTLTLNVTESEAGAIWLVEDGSMRCAVAAGPASAQLQGRVQPIDEGAIGEAIRQRRPLVVHDALDDARFAVYRHPGTGFSTRSAVVIPLKVDGRGVGAIELVNDVGGKDHFSDDDIAFLEALADDAAAAVRNASLFEAERRAHHFQTELNLFGQLFVAVIVMLAIGIAFSAAVGQGVSPLLEVSYSWAGMLIFLAVVLRFARRNDIPLAEFGVTTRGWKRHALEGFLFALPVIAVMPIIKWLMYGGTEPMVTYASYASYPAALFTFHLLFYLPHSYLQELAARGLIQGSLTRFLPGSHPLVPVAVTSALFGVGHIHASFVFAFLTLVMSFYLGVIYMRHRSLVGVTVTHVATGQVALALGFF